MTAPAPASGAAERARLFETDNSAKEIVFALNPTQIQFSRAVKFNRQAAPNSTSKADPPAQFTGTDATQLQVQLLLDAMGTKNGTIQPQIDRLVEWTTVPDSTPTASPPQLTFTWGALIVGDKGGFRGFLEQLRVTVEMFGRDGTPLRANIALSLKSGVLAPQGTNPTSGTETSRKRRVLRRGQTLQSLAYEEFGEAGAWRLVAELNGIDDPTRLRPGQEIMLPDRRELVARWN